MTDAPTESAISEERLAERLRKAIARSEDGGGTVPAREAVKLRPKYWHAVCDRSREAAALIDTLRARLAAAGDAPHSHRHDQPDQQIDWKTPPEHEADLARVSGEEKRRYSPSAARWARTI